MQLSESWLRSFVDPALSTDELAHALTMRGLEVEDVRPVAPPFDGIVVGEVLDVAKHPNADRLAVCKVRVSPGGEPLNIVCGAPNVAVGIKVPTALVGAVLPPPKDGDAPFEIRRATMRGVASEGMLCSARELKLSDDHSGLLILSNDAVVGAPLRDVLDLDDHVFTLKLTPNKGDCLSALGVAREVAALSGMPLAEPSYAAVTPTIDEVLPVRIDAPELCGRFSGRIVRGLDACAVTPTWMKERLARSGQRSVSALVDISNYVMLEVGRPTHVFDLAKLHGGLAVRWAKDGESLKLLNGDTVALTPDVGVIADAFDGREVIESMAGIMGGDATAVSLETTDIYVEAAFWWPDAIRGRARRYGFSTDAAHRFERGVDPATTVEHIERITRLVLDICGTDATRVGSVDDRIVALPARTPVRMRVARAAQVIGIPIEGDEIAAIFASFGFAFTREEDAAGETFVVSAPTYRFDIEIEEDLIEEVARGYGFEKIPAHLPVARHRMRARPEARRSVHAVADALAARDYREAINYSFVEADWERDFAGNDEPIRLLNPIAAPLAVMRSSLVGSLVANVRFNANRKATRVRMFEIAKVYRRDLEAGDGPLSVAGIVQPLQVGGIAWGTVAADQWGIASRPVDFFDVKADVEALFVGLGLEAAPTFERTVHPALHPGRAARIESAGRVVGFIGELHPRWAQRYELPSPPVVFEVAGDALMQVAPPTVEPVSRFPTVVRDLALIVDAALPAGRVMDAIEVARSGQHGLVRDVKLFDQYRGKGLNENEKSLAFRFWLQDTRQTLDETAIESAMANIVTTLGNSVGARLR